MRALITGLTLATLVLAGCGPDEPTTTEPIVDEPVDDETGDDSAADDESAGDVTASDEPDPAGTDDDGGSTSAPADTAGTADEPDEGSPSDSDGDAADDPDDGVTVSIDDFLFDDDAISIAVGDTVTWTHDGRITHNVTARDGSFASDNLSAGDTFSHTFTDAGEFTYVCTLHSQMIATVEVG